MGYRPIEDYGIIGNLHTVALVCRSGSIDWFCFPHLDSPSVFGALLDDQKGGRFLVQPTGEFDSASGYLPRTNILTTRFRNRTGILKVTDFMPVPRSGPEEREEERHVLYRLIEIEKGEMEVLVRFEPRFDYARAETSVRPVEGGCLAEGGGRSLALMSTRPLESRDDRARAVWTLKAGDRVSLRAGSTGEAGQCCDLDFVPADVGRSEEDLRETEQFWHEWLSRHETGRSFSYGYYQDRIDRSALALKLLYYNPSGTIAAAATTSLPEQIGGERNWDYRFTWVRDTAFTLEALFNLGHLSEMEGYLRWIERILAEYGTDKMQIMYGLRGELDLEESDLEHLDGYKGSRPVRIGNDAAKQRQMDIYGELLGAALKLSDYVGKINAEQWPAIRKICEYVVGHWRERDSGIWEVRGGLRDFVYSKVMCWVALDRGITIAGRYGFEADLGTWSEARDAIHREVCDRGFNEEKQAFVQSYGSDVLDSSNLLIPMLGFLPFDDPRVVSTVDAIIRELSHDGLLYRYRGEDGLDGEEGTFLLCSFWLVECLARMGRLTEAEGLLRRLERTANHLGLFSEEYDVRWQQALGNFPQAFTHIGYVNSVRRLIQARQEERRWSGEEETSGLTLESVKDSLRKVLLFSEIVLNEGEPDYVIPPDELAPTLKSIMNLLRGAYFDTARGRVAYERMKDSDLYREYVMATRSLREFDPEVLQTREERIAFWVNLYNVIVIHGVVELDIRNSVREVRRFFRRIRYVIGENEYTPDDIEHGILRANRKPPHSLFRVFGSGDPRLSHSLEEEDPRIHFALVCASSSCPPIDLYTAENLGRELDQAGRSFLNGGGLVLNREENTVVLSRIFKWYGEDFGEDRGAILRRLSGFLYDSDAGDFLKRHAEDVKVEYQEYDWRLNRGDQGKSSPYRTRTSGASAAIP